MPQTEKKQQKLWEQDLVPQVVETNLNENPPPEKCFGFIYCWTNLDNKKWYRGKHQGYPRDGYLFSSKNEDFLVDFTDPNSRWKYEILDYVTTSTTDLTNLEYEILTELDARNDPMSYNLSNGIPVKTNDNTPDIVFYTNEAGSVSVSSPCLSEETEADSGNNTLTLRLINKGWGIENFFVSLTDSLSQNYFSKPSCPCWCQRLPHCHQSLLHKSARHRLLVLIPIPIPHVLYQQIRPIFHPPQ